MVLYEEIVRAKFDAGHETALELEKLERGRRQSERIRQLESSIRELEVKVEQLRRLMTGLAEKYQPRLTEVEVEVERYREDLARILQEMSSSALTRYNLSSELGIYGELLTSEESRMTSHGSQVRLEAGLRSVESWCPSTE